MPFHIWYLQIGPVNFCVTSQYVAQIEMKNEKFQQTGLKKIDKEEEIGSLNKKWLFHP